MQQVKSKKPSDNYEGGELETSADIEKMKPRRSHIINL